MTTSPSYTIRLIAGLLFCACPIAALAIPFSSPDPRSLAMGGVGVASATSANASFFNPALLSVADKSDRFSLEFPIIGAHIADPDNLRDAVDGFDNGNYIARFRTALQGYNTALNTAKTNPTQANIDSFLAQARSLTAASDALVTGLNDLSNRALQADGGIGTVIGVPGRRFGVAVFANVWAAGGGQGVVTSQDVQTVRKVINDVDAVITAVETNTLPVGNVALQDVTAPDKLTSFVEARFAVLAEVGVSLGRQFRIEGERVAFGLTPKYVEVRTYDYAFDQSTLDSASIDLNTGERKDSNFNLDVGVAIDHRNGWRSGLSIRNVVDQSYTTVRNHTIRVRPAARIGVAYRNDWWSIAGDLDLTENDPVGFESKTRYLGIGTEIDLWDTLQFRLGLRANLSDSDTNTVSLGLGFSPFGAHVDLGVSAGKNEIGGALQLGFRF